MGHACSARFWGVLSVAEGSGERVEPSGLGDRASAFWRVIVAEFDLSDAEVELLTEAAWMLTEIDSLRAALERDGVTVAGSAGQRRVHPAVGEIRQHRLALARLVKVLDLPLEEVESESWESKNARQAANTRWAMARARQAGNG